MDLVPAVPRAGGPARSAMMPRLGEALEPVHAGPVQPWWRSAAPGPSAAPAPAADAAPPRLVREPPWPLD